MTLPLNSDPITKQDSEITETVLRERKKLGSFILRRVSDQSEADDILQDVFYEFMQAYHLPSPIEQASAWLFRVARNRIIDRFRKKKEQSLYAMDGASDAADECDSEYRLDLLLPASEEGPEALYARSELIKELQIALDELPENQRDVFIAHELEGISFKQMSLQSGVAINTLLARKRYAVLYLRTRLQSIYDEFEL
jgi:RNA polymerase sigma factor (sigma-70 family)